MRSGNACGASTCALERIAARSMAFRSSRTFPGHEYAKSALAASGDSSGGGRRAARAKKERNRRASGRISSLRSRNGGTGTRAPSSPESRASRERAPLTAAPRARVVAAAKRTAPRPGRASPTRPGEIASWGGVGEQALQVDQLALEPAALFALLHHVPHLRRRERLGQVVARPATDRLDRRVEGGVSGDDHDVQAGPLREEAGEQ